jgi:hypothetical protein
MARLAVVLHYLLFMAESPPQYLIKGSLKKKQSASAHSYDRLLPLSPQYHPLIEGGDSLWQERPLEAENP